MKLNSSSTVCSSQVGAVHRRSWRLVDPRVIMSVASAALEPEGLYNRAVPIEDFLLDRREVAANLPFDRIGCKDCLDYCPAPFAMDMREFQNLSISMTIFADTLTRHPLLTCEQIDGIPDARSQVAVEFANGAFKCSHASALLLRPQNSIASSVKN